jgi:hypothetical protein
MESQFNFENHYQQIKIAVIIAIILGLATAVFFIVVNKESYSAIYIVPNSIIHNPGDNTVLYAFGVKSSETGIMDYTLDTYVGTTLTKSKQFSLKPGEILDERDQITLQPEATYPLKIGLNLTTKTTSQEVHFWLK